MRIAAIQFAPSFQDLSANLERIHGFIDEVDAEVIVLPELATSGYFFHTVKEARPFALHAESPEVEGLIAHALSANKVVVCGIAEDAEHVLYNSALICGPNITPQWYRKTHLFHREKNVFDPGNSGFFTTFLPHLKCTIGTMICYDWRFPESARTLALKGADVIVAPSNLITNIWRTVMPTRAIENKVYLVVANRTGSEENGGERLDFNGDSAIYAYNGEVMASANGTDDSIVMAEIEPEKTRSKSFNSFNDIFADRRPELYR